MPDLPPRGLVFSCDIGLQCVQSLFPKLSVMLQPLICFAQRTGLDPTVVFASFDLATQNSCTLQRHNMFRNCIERNPEGLGDLIDSGGTVSESSQNGASCWVCQRGEDTIQLCGLR